MAQKSLPISAYQEGWHMAKLDELKSKRASETAAAFGSGALTNLDPLLQASNRLLEGWMALSSEILEFGKTRIDRGLEMSKAMAQSTSLNEALDLQATYTRSIVQDYVSEAHKIVDLSTRSLLDSFSTLQQQTREKVRDAAYHAEAAE
jgi:hypothetical protein